MSSFDPDLEKLRESYLASLREAAGNAKETPDAERIWGAVSGALPPEERLQVIDRVASDPAWAEAWRLANEIWTAAPRQTSFWRDHRYLAAAASLAAVIAGGILLRDVLAPEPEYRDPGAARIESLVSEDERLARDNVVLRWTEVHPAARYEVTVTTEALQVISTGRDLEEPEYRVPPGSLSDLAPGTRLFWQVASRLPDGSESRSPTFFVTIE